MTSISHHPGVGLRLPHLAEMVVTRPTAGWLEVHPENFLANPHAAELLTELSAHYPISLHTVGISVGSATGIDCLHLKRIRDFADRINPILVSGHLAWSAYKNEYINDLLPLPYTEEALRIVSAHVNQVQDGLGRPYLIENPASYLGFQSSTMRETDFLSELVQRTACQLLCDVSNVVVSAHNMDFDPYQYIDDFPAGAVREVHLGGYTPEADEATPSAELWIDTHAAPIAEPSWDLYVYALRRFGPRPTLIEWDNQLPSLPALMNEAAYANKIALEVGHAFAR
ncbi:MAG: hypothetical protein DMG15_00625 [Acidobacteria bacterium]|nr:MAG: hypothetical protein DMG16_02170 [Acidobacteriota bacterium]PYS16996.1 MAG: hypothetical protein DMG15_00625 [Acidobacteriota bacterium]